MAFKVIQFIMIYSIFVALLLTLKRRNASFYGKLILFIFLMALANIVSLFFVC